METGDIVRLVAYAVISLALAWISRASLRTPRSHGFSRFFAWESIAALVVLKADVWFRQPFAWNQLISWALLLGSIPPLVLGVRGLRGQGKPAERREGDPSLLAFEKTSQLVTSGIYAYIRHPLYASLLLLAWGVFFKQPDLFGALLGLAATLLLVATARADEDECLRFFGPPYRDYMRRTRMFVPYLF